MGTWRVAEEKRIAESLDALAKAASSSTSSSGTGASSSSSSGAAAAAAPSSRIGGSLKTPLEARRDAIKRSFNAEQLSNLLDRWSLGQLVTLLS